LWRDGIRKRISDETGAAIKTGWPPNIAKQGRSGSGKDASQPWLTRKQSGNTAGTHNGFR
jgi:hypothetical protein